MNKIISFSEMCKIVRCHRDTIRPVLEELGIEPVHAAGNDKVKRFYYDREVFLQHATTINEKIKARRVAAKQTREKLAQNLAKGRAVLAEKMAAKKEALVNEVALLPLTTLIETVRRVEGKLDQLIKAFT